MKVQSKQQICDSFTLLISYMLFNPFKMVVQLFKTASNFHNFDDPNAFFFLNPEKSVLLEPQQSSH